MSKPTAAHKRYWGLVFEVGCIACLIEGKHSKPEIHHWRTYGRRNHSIVFGLCPIHHRPTAGVTGIPSRHGAPIEFAAKFGTDEQLFKICVEHIGRSK